MGAWHRRGCVGVACVPWGSAKGAWCGRAWQGRGVHGRGNACGEGVAAWAWAWRAWAGNGRNGGMARLAHLLLELHADGVGLLEEDGVAPQQVPQRRELVPLPLPEGPQRQLALPLRPLDCAERRAQSMRGGGSGPQGSTNSLGCSERGRTGRPASGSSPQAPRRPPRPRRECEGPESQAGAQRGLGAAVGLGQEDGLRPGTLHPQIDESRQGRPGLIRPRGQPADRRPCGT